VLAMVFATALVLSVVNSYLSPVKWAKEAPMTPVLIGGAQSDWTLLESRITDEERAGTGLDQLYYYVRERQDSRPGTEMPIPYRQWAKEQSERSWLPWPDK